MVPEDDTQQDQCKGDDGVVVKKGMIKEGARKLPKVQVSSPTQGRPAGNTEQSQSDSKQE